MIFGKMHNLSKNVTQLCNVYALGPDIIYYGPKAGPRDALLRSRAPPRDNLVSPMGVSLGPY